MGLTSLLAILTDMKLRKVGNTLVVTIPKRLADAMGWEEADKLQILVTGKDVLREAKEG